MTIGERIKDLRVKRGYTQEELAKRVGFKSKSSIAKIENGDKVSLDHITLLSQGLDCDVAYLMGWQLGTVIEENGVRKFKYESVPVKMPTSTIHLLGRVAAGSPIFAEENIVGELDVPTMWAKKDEYYGLTIKGNSMEPKIANGDIVIVHSQEDAESGEIVIATLNGDDAVCKRLMKYGETILLRSFNSEYDDIDVTANQDFRIWGKVIESRHRF